VNLINYFYTSKEEIVAQAATSTTTIFANIICVLLAASTSLVTSPSQTKNFVEAISPLRSVSTLMSFFTSCVDPIIQAFLVHVVGVPAVDDLNTADAKNVSEAIEFYNSRMYNYPAVIGLNGADKATLAKNVETHYLNLTFIYERLCAKPSTKVLPICSAIQSYVTKYQKFINDEPSLGLSINVKVSRAPFTVMILGHPGVGKSSISNEIARVCYTSDGLENWDQSQIYPRTTSQYWEGYHNQHCVRFDDFGSMQDTAGNPNPNYSDLINLGVDGLKSLNMADVVGKGRTFFTSKLIVLTANNKFNPVSLTNPEAIPRRIHQEWEVYYDLSTLSDDDKSLYFITSPEGKYSIKSNCPTEVYLQTFRAKLLKLHDSFPSSPDFHLKEGESIHFLRWVDAVKMHYTAHHQPSTHSTAITDAVNKYLSIHDNKFAGPHAQGGAYSTFFEVSDIIFNDCTYTTAPQRATAIASSMVNIGIAEISPHYIAMKAQCTALLTKISAALEKLSNCVTSASYEIWMKLKVGFYLLTLNVEAFLDQYGWEVLLSMGTAMLFAISCITITIGLSVIAKLATSLFSGDNNTSDSTCVSQEYRKGYRPRNVSKRDRREMRDLWRDAYLDELDNYDINPNTHYNQSPNPEPPEILTPEESDQFSKVLTSFAQNTFQLYIVNNAGKEIKMGSCIFIGDVHFIVPCHTWKSICLKEKYRLGHSGKFAHWKTLSITRLTANEDVTELFDNNGHPTDVVMVRISELASRPSIITHFPTEQQWKGMVNSASDLILPFTRVRPDGTAYTAVSPGYESSFRNSHITYLNGSTGITLKRYISYKSFSAGGDCGTAIIGSDTKQPRILGLHTFGSGNEEDCTLSGGAFVSQEMIKRGLSHFKPSCQSPALHTEENPYLHFYNSTIPTVAIVSEKKYVPHTDRKTKIKPSILHNKIPSCQANTAPAALKSVKLPDGTTIDPFVAGTTKIDTPSVVLPKSKFRRLIKLYEEKHLRSFSHTTGPLSWEKACWPDFEVYRNSSGINLSSSSGFSHSVGNGKKDLIGTRNDWFIDPHLLQRLTGFVSAAEQNETIKLPFVETMKDERRPVEKVKLGKTRTFSAGQIEFVILFRAYFLPILDYLKTHRISNCVAIGMNVFSKEWDQIAHIFSKFSKPAVIAGDFSSFDASLMQVLLELIGDMLIGAFNDGEANKKVRQALWSNITHSLRISGHWVLAFGRGNPSGCPITAELNSLYNLFATMYAYSLVSDQVENFFKDVDFLAYGDDNLIQMNPDGHFTIADLVDGYAKMGMIYTSTDKDGPPVPQFINQASFLKRSFVFDKERNRWVCPLEPKTIADMINWTKDGKTVTTAQVVETALFEQSLHGREKYNQLVGEFKLAFKNPELEAVARRVQILSYEGQLEAFHSRGSWSAPEDYDPDIWL
jgi:hypothetical protein